MNSSQRPARLLWQPAWVLAGLAAMALAVALVLALGARWPRSDTPAPTLTASGRATPQAQTSGQAPTTRLRPDAVEPTPPEVVPQGLSAEQLQQLRASLAEHPQREAEVARVSAYLQYSAQWQHFVQRRAAGATAEELRPLARTLDQGLAERLSQREVSAGEALHIKTALLEVLAPDTAARQGSLREWRERNSAAMPAAPDPQTAEFERRQAQIVANWRALPPAQRDTHKLEADLEALRQSSFAAPPAVPTQGDRR